MNRYPNEQLDCEDMDGAAKERKLAAVSSRALLAEITADKLRFYLDESEVSDFALGLVIHRVRKIIRANLKLRLRKERSE